MDAQSHRAGDNVREGPDIARSEQHHEPRDQTRLDNHEVTDLINRNTEVQSAPQSTSTQRRFDCWTARSKRVMEYTHKSRTTQVHKTTRNSTQPRTSWRSDFKAILDSVSTPVGLGRTPRYTSVHYDGEAVGGTALQNVMHTHHNRFPHRFPHSGACNEFP